MYHIRLLYGKVEVWGGVFNRENNGWICDEIAQKMGVREVLEEESNMDSL